jgi:hypothetical protein
MKKSIILLLLIVIVSIFIISCPPMSTVFYCPYCSSPSITQVEGQPGVFQCNRDGCGKKFGAMEVTRILN